MTTPTIEHFKHTDEYDIYTAGSVIFSAGNADDKMYVVKTGEVDIMFNGHVLETVAAGGILGEKSLVDDAPHTTTAIAKTDSQIVPVDEKKFLFLIHETPTFALQVMRIMAERTRNLMLRTIG